MRALMSFTDVLGALTHLFSSRKAPTIILGNEYEGDFT